MYQRPSSPLSIGGVLDDGFKLLRDSFSRVFPLALLSGLVSQVPGAVMDPGAIQNTDVPLLAIVGSLAALLAGVVFFGAMIARVEAVAQGEALSLGGSIGIGLRRFFMVLVCGLLLSFALAGGLVLLVIPGLILMVTLLFGPYLVVTDRMGPLAALKQSHRLVWGNWWRTTAIVTVIVAVVSVAYVLAGIAAALLVSAGGEFDTTMALVNWILVPGVTAIVSPVSYALFVATVNDLKIRREGDDLANRVEELAGA